MTQRINKPVSGKNDDMEAEMHEELEIMLKSGATMPKSEGISYVENQSAAIFNKYNTPPLAVAERRLTKAQDEHTRLKFKLKELRIERKKIPDITTENKGDSND